MASRTAKTASPSILEINIGDLIAFHMSPKFIDNPLGVVVEQHNAAYWIVEWNHGATTVHHQSFILTRKHWLRRNASSKV